MFTTASKSRDFIGYFEFPYLIGDIIKPSILRIIVGNAKFISTIKPAKIYTLIDGRQGKICSKINFSRYITKK